MYLIDQKIKNGEGFTQGTTGHGNTLGSRPTFPIWLPAGLAGNSKGQVQERLNLETEPETRKHGVRRCWRGLRIDSSTTGMESGGDPWGAVFQCGLTTAEFWSCIDLKSPDQLPFNEEPGDHLHLNLPPGG